MKVKELVYKLEDCNPNLTVMVNIGGNLMNVGTVWSDDWEDDEGDEIVTIDV